MTILNNPNHKNPLSYAFICVRCAGVLGGKMGDRSSTWHIGKCDCCESETQVTQPRDFIWRI